MATRSSCTPGTYNERVYTSPKPPHWGAGDQYAPPLIVWKDNLTIKADNPDPALTVIACTPAYYFWVNAYIPGGGGGGSIEKSTGGIWDSVAKVFNGPCVRPMFGTPPNAVDIIASGVILDGFTIRRPYDVRTGGHDAVMIGGLYAGDTQFPGHANNNTVRNCVIEDSGKSAIAIWHSSDNVIENNTIRRINARAISIYDGYSNAEVGVPNPSKNNVIQYNNVSESWGGIYVGAWNDAGPAPTFALTDNSGTRIVGNNLYNLTDFGIGFGDTVSGDVVVEGNTINTNYGGSIRSTRRTTFTNITVASNTVIAGSGTNNIQLFSMTGGSINGNIVGAGLGNGIHLSIMTGGSVSGNVVSNRVANGIALLSSSGVAITGNTTTDNGASGIVLVSTSNVAVSQNIILRNTGNVANPGGLTIREGVGSTTVTDNTINNNAKFGVWINSAAFTGNVFHFNNIVGNGTGPINTGMLNNLAITVNAENNWWGDPTGPYNLASNPTGLCNGVNDTVDFNPWIAGLSYTGATTFLMVPVVLEATLVDSAGNGLPAPVPSVSVEFFANDISVSFATTDTNGVAQLPVSLPADVYNVRAVVTGGGLLGNCLANQFASATVTVIAPPVITKQDVLAELIALRATVTDKQDGNKLDEAIKHLTKSLTPAWWIDDTRLQAKEGEKVFNEEKDAVNQLRNLIKNKKSSISDVTLQSFVDRIVAADRLLAVVAIADATGGDPKDIDKANDELGKGDNETAKGKYDSAIEHYRNAWKFAQKAIK